RTCPPRQSFRRSFCLKLCTLHSARAALRPSVAQAFLHPARERQIGWDPQKLAALPDLPEAGGFAGGGGGPRALASVLLVFFLLSVPPGASRPLRQIGDDHLQQIPVVFQPYFLESLLDFKR